MRVASPLDCRLATIGVEMSRLAPFLLALAVSRPASAGELREPVMTALSGIEDPPTAEAGPAQEI